MDVLGVREADELVDGEPILDLAELAEAELGIAHIGVDGLAVEPVALVEQGGGGVKVMQGHIGLDAILFAAGEQLVVVLNALGEGSASSPLGKMRVQAMDTRMALSPCSAERRISSS